MRIAALCPRPGLNWRRPARAAAAHAQATVDQRALEQAQAPTPAPPSRHRPCASRPRRPAPAPARRTPPPRRNRPPPPPSPLRPPRRRRRCGCRRAPAPPVLPPPGRGADPPAAAAAAGPGHRERARAAEHSAADGLRVTFGAGSTDLNPATEGGDARPRPRRPRRCQLHRHRLRRRPPDDPSTPPAAVAVARAGGASRAAGRGVPSARIYVKALGRGGAADGPPDRVDADRGRNKSAGKGAPNDPPTNRYLIRMLVFLVAVAVVAGLLSGALLCRLRQQRAAQQADRAGAGARHRLEPAAGAAAEPGGDLARNLPARAPPAGRAALAAPAGADGRHARGARRQGARGDGTSDRFTISAAAMRSLLDSIASRLDESRELSRYMTGLLIFLGLLGTFWGLLLTVQLGGRRHRLDVGRLRRHQRAVRAAESPAWPGRCTAWARRSPPRMLGLAGALVLGFLDLTAGQAQNRFFNELEEWLAGITRLSSGVLGGEGRRLGARSMSRRCWSRPPRTWRTCSASWRAARTAGGEANHAVLEPDRTHRDAVRHDARQPATDAAHRRKPAGDSAPRCNGWANAAGRNRHDDATRAHLRNIELYLQRLLTESEQGRAQTHRRTSATTSAS